VSSRAALVLLLGLGLGCAARSGRAPTVSAQAPADWSTPQGKLSTQLELAEQLIDLERPREALALLAMVRLEQARPVLALDVLQARATLDLGMAGEAAAILEPWNERPPRDADFHALLGLVYYDQRAYEPAEAAFRRAIELEPQHFDAHNNLGFLLLSSGRPDQAIPELRAALGLRPNDRRARNNLGFALAATGADDQALEVFRAVNPEPTALANMALAAERRGDTDQAIAWYHQVLAVVPDHGAATSAIHRLDPPDQRETTP
jgi:tetratricopeptide (TPR) repeat protein